ncbi:AB hydrolase superfamily protein B1A11.02 [Aspergillus lentulus]|uniref:AB hydrolase superfamily protein B1A11.02 n=1 Tax=Aspergillus lentulus TaxID=293939 RepID=A0ABQ1ALT7_ASPLE|nr:AB hydrolase superfamily protein B1A11.02 [Aspergillus lentulus]GFF96777.1 AB hydrolase superfamily protein B1A11.02 [Aspergillus lentulus]
MNCHGCQPSNKCPYTGGPYTVRREAFEGLGGVSAGGSLDIVTAHHAAKENMVPPFTGSWASVPATGNEEAVPDKYKDLWFSQEQNANSPVLGAIFTNMNTFGLMPSSFVQVRGMDSRREASLIYERALRDHSAKTRLNAFPGVSHGHWVIFPTSRASGLVMLYAIRGMGLLLGQEPEK